MDLDPPSLWSTQTLLTGTRPLLVTVVWAQSETHTWQAYTEEFTWTSQAFSGVHRLSDSLWLCLARCCLCFCRSARLLLSALSFLRLTNSFLLLCLFVALKPICVLTVRFRFPAFWFPCLCPFEFLCSASSSLYNASKGGGHLFHNELSVSSLGNVWTVVISV